MNHIPKIIVKTIDASNQRFAEVGDWFFDAEANEVTIFISRMGDWRSELAVAIHEIYESVCCIADGVDQTDVDAFDKKFYQENDEGEAGDQKEAPYFDQHCSATFIEKEVIAQMGLSWTEHEKTCDDE